MARKHNKKESEATEAKETRAAREKAKDDMTRTKKGRTAGSPIRNLIIFAAASVIIGVSFILYPDIIEMYCGYIIGGIVAVIGLVNVICYFAKKMVDGVYRSEFVVGIIAIAAGAYVALLSGGTLSFILLVLGLLCAVDGLLKIQYTLDLARMHYEKWWLPLIMGALGLGIGVIIVMGLLADLAGSSVNNQLMYLGATFCLNCVLDVITIVVIAVRNSKAAHEVVHDAATSETFTSESESAARPVSPQPNLQPVPPQPIPQPVPPQPEIQPVPSQPTTQPEEPVAMSDSAPEVPVSQEEASIL